MHKRKKLTKKERAKKAERDARRGRTPAYLKAKRWERDHVKKTQTFSLPRIVAKKQEEDLAR